MCAEYAATGAGYGNDYLIQDYGLAVLTSAKAMAMTVIDLLAGNADKAKAVLDASPPPLSKSQYLALQDSRLTEELYDGKPY